MNQADKEGLVGALSAGNNAMRELVEMEKLLAHGGGLRAKIYESICTVEFVICAIKAEIADGEVKQ